MRYRKFLLFWIGAIFICFMAVIPGSAQHRDYYIYGKIVDSKNQPIPKVEIALRDINTSRSYSFKTNKKGEFKFVGLPSGVYQVTMEKEGYRTKTDEWKFEIKPDRMQKINLKTIAMISEEHLKEINQAKQIQKDFETASEKIQKNEFDDALSILEKILKEKPNDENAIYLTGICYFKKNMLPEAIEAFSKVNTLNPVFPGAYYHLGICYQKQNQLDKSLTFYQKALELDPKNFISLFNGGLVFYKLKRYSEALTYFEKALELKPDDPEILEFIGLCFIQNENYKKALEYLKKAKNASANEEKIKSLDVLIKDLKEQRKIP
jgi:tetratricopeptide (TPR) repeat protein